MRRVLIESAQRKKHQDHGAGRHPESLDLGEIAASRFCTFVDEIIGLPLALSLFPQVYDFQGEAVIALVERGLYRNGFHVRCDADNKPKGQQ